MGIGGKSTYIVSTQHFDILWRRPQEYYRDLEVQIIRRVLDIIDQHPEFKFTFHQANILRYFVENSPGSGDTLKRRLPMDRSRLPVVWRPSRTRIWSRVRH